MVVFTAAVPQAEYSSVKKVNDSAGDGDDDFGDFGDAATTNTIFGNPIGIKNDIAVNNQI